MKAMRPSYRSLLEDTRWDQYGVGRNPKCNNCMAHCGFEGTAVDDAFAHPIKALKAALRGPRVTGPMAPELPILYGEGLPDFAVAVPITQVRRASGSDGGVQRGCRSEPGGGYSTCPAGGAG